MNIGIITSTNKKGQIVIPKKLRDALAIKPDVPLHVTVRDGGVHIAPVNQIITNIHDDRSVYLELLKKTRGTWAEDDWDKMRKKRRRIELAASKKRKEAW